MERLRLTIEGNAYYADLLPDEAPRVIGAIRSAGAIDSFLVYAKICDHEITWPVPFLVDEVENPVWDETPGNVIYYPPNQAICIFYGPSPSVAECSKFASVPPEELGRLKAVADRVWANQGMRVRTEVVDVEGVRR